MANYIEGFKAGLLDSLGNPALTINRAIVTEQNDTYDGYNLGTVIAKFNGYCSISLEDEENWYELTKEYGADFAGLFTRMGWPMFYIEVDGRYSVFSPPVRSPKYPNHYSHYGYGLDGVYYSTSSSSITGSSSGSLVITHYANKKEKYRLDLVDDSNIYYQASSFDYFTPEVSIDLEGEPTSAEPIPPSDSDLPAPGITYFGLTLKWMSDDSDENFTVDDYNVSASCYEFDLEQYFKPSEDGSVLEIIKPYDGLLLVEITHNIYDISATGKYGVVEAGPYDPGGGQGPSGGNGSFNDGESEDIKQLIPDGSAGPDTSNLGLYTRYLMTASQIREFGDFLYADNLVESITNGIMKALFDSPAEAVISLMHYPFDVSAVTPTNAGTIWYGNLNTGKESSGVMNRSYSRIEWGSISLGEFWGNFLDYAPHTKIDLYLPWCVGSVPIDPHECLPGSLEVITNIEFDKGTCVHTVVGNNNAVIGTYSGVVGTQIPVTALDSSGKALSFVTAAVAGAVTAGATGAATSAGIRAANSWQTSAATVGMGLSERNRFVEGVIQQAEAPYRRVARGARNTALASSAASFRVPPNITRNGSFSGNGAALGIQVPYIIISRPTQSVPQNYGRHYGYPSNIYASLGSLSGYTEVGSIHLDGFSCTVEERNEIEELLMGGVVL